MIPDWKLGKIKNFEIHIHRTRDEKLEARLTWHNNSKKFGPHGNLKNLLDDVQQFLVYY